ncbi:MAG: hypothetical protein QGG36_18610 [Pirellulaceae bacterium]|jgi:hypothetical protein|nr:hypothetical protein [Pirellulaceae bacterium]MDP7017824.1 hypothetical protein [Pirellulaceae bacterium]
MPIGSYTALPHVVHSLLEFRPQRLLDLGIGFGFFGGVVRQWLDYGVKPWKSYLVGVESFEGYGNPMWDLYNLVVVDTIENYLASCEETFQGVVLSDVVEHFSREDGWAVMNRATELLEPGGRMLVATPSVFVEQGAVHGNPREAHQSLWTTDDLAELGFKVLLDGKPDQFLSEMIVAEWTKK